MFVLSSHLGITFDEFFCKHCGWALTSVRGMWWFGVVREGPACLGGYGGVRVPVVQGGSCAGSGEQSGTGWGGKKQIHWGVLRGIHLEIRQIVCLEKTKTVTEELRLWQWSEKLPTKPQSHWRGAVKPSSASPHSTVNISAPSHNNYSLAKPFQCPFPLQFKSKSRAWDTSKQHLSLGKLLEMSEQSLHFAVFIHRKPCGSRQDLAAGPLSPSLAAGAWQGVAFPRAQCNQMDVTES